MFLLTDTQIDYTPQYVNIGVLCFGLILCALLLWKIKFADKGYKLLFFTYLLFWVPLMLTRDNTGNIERAIEPGKTNYYVWIPLMSYGLIGIFARTFGDWFCFKNKSRKSFIYFAFFIQLVTYIPIIIYPSLATNIIQSIGVGIGASCVGTYQLFFNEQYGKSKHFLTISILSIPPLLADIISAPISSIFRSSNQFDADSLKYLWLIGLGFVLIAFILTLFIKENRELLFLDNQNKTPLKNKKEYLNFILLSFVGLLVIFIKFANSGATAEMHVQTISKNTSGPYEAYLTLIFNVGQLLAGVLTGLVLTKYFDDLYIFISGIVIWIIYISTTILIENPFVYMGIHVLNGIGYGILYNLIMIFVLRYFFEKTKKVTPMGIYQSILSIGIACSNTLVGWLKGQYNSKDIDAYLNEMKIIGAILIAASVVCLGLFCLNYQLNKRWIKR